MKKYSLLSLCLFSVFLSSAQTMYPSGVSGCIARWTFDTEEQSALLSLPDMSGNGNHGSTNNIATSSGFRDIPNRAGAFDGTSSYAQVPHAAMLNPSEITIISLVKFNGFYSGNCQINQILSKGYPHFFSGNYGQGVGDSPFDGSCSVFSPNNEQLLSQIGTSTAVTPSAGNYMSQNKWYFLASTHSSNNIKHYQIEMDTSFKASILLPINVVNGAFSLGANSQSISIGKHLNPTYPYWVNGVMDEVILFNRALSDADIYSVYSYLWGWSTGTTELLNQDQKFECTIGTETIKVNSTQLNYSIEVSNSVGQLLLKKTNCNGTQLLPVSKVGSNMYIIKITDSSHKIYIKKFL